MEKSIDFIKGLIIVILVSALATVALWFFTSNITPEEKPTASQEGLHVHVLDKNSKLVQNLPYPFMKNMDLCVNRSCYLSDLELGKYASDGFDKSDLTFDDLMLLAYYNETNYLEELTINKLKRKSMFMKYWGPETVYKEEQINEKYCISDRYLEINQTYHVNNHCNAKIVSGSSIPFYTSTIHQAIENRNHLVVYFYMLYYKASEISQGKVKYEIYGDKDLTNKLSEVERFVDNSSYVLEQEALEEYINEHTSQLEKYAIYFEKQNNGKYYFIQAKKIYTVK